MLYSTNWLVLSGIKGFFYLDPGSGSVLLQVILAVVLGIGIVVRTQWARFKSFFSSKKKPASPPDNEQ